MSEPRHISVAETIETLNRQRAELRRAGGIAAASALAGVQALMRPDDVRPGPGRFAYRLGYAGLAAASSWVIPGSLDGDGVEERDVRTDAVIAATSGVLGFAMFSPRFGINWWSDRVLARLGVQDTRLIGAIGSAAITAAALALADRVARGAQSGEDPAAGPLPEVTAPGEGAGAFIDESVEEFVAEPVELTAGQRAVLDRLVLGNSANAKLLREQLRTADVHSLGGHELLHIEVSQPTEERIVPYDHTHPVRGRYNDAEGNQLEIVLTIEGGRLAGVEIQPVVEELGEDDDIPEVSGLTPEDWPAAEELTVVRDER